MNRPPYRSAEVAGWRHPVIAALFVSLLASARVAIAVLPTEPLEHTPEASEVDAVGNPGGPPTASKVLGDTVWIADWTFDAPGGGCTDAGWVKYDNRIVSDGSNCWSVDNRLSGTGGIVGNAAILSRHNLCWARDGYGNNWDYSIILKYSGVGATLSFDKVSDSEAGYDYVTVETDSLGLSESLVNLCLQPYYANPAAWRTEILTGLSGYDPGSHIGPLVLTNFGAGTHEVYIRFTADTGFSDEDGNWPTVHNAGLIVDNIIVTGGTAYSENFEGSLNANVTLANTASAAPFCAAPWVRLFSHITDNDKCTEDITCAWLGTDPLRTAFFLDMAFGPGQAVIHNWLDDIIVSPWVSLAATPGATATILSFRRLAANPFGTGAIVQGWRVRAKTKRDNTDTPAAGDSVDCIGLWGHANQFNSLGSFQWLTSLFNMTTNFTPAAREIQLSFRTVDWNVPSLFVQGHAPSPLNTGPGPYVDRIRIGRRVLTGPAIDVGSDTRTQAQDAFSTAQNSIVPGQHFSPDGANRFGTCAFSAAADLGNTTSRLITGDSIYLNGVVDARGAGGVATVVFYGAIVAGPHAGKSPAPFTVGGNGFFAVAADSARNNLGTVVANCWFVDLDDTYFRGGDQLDYFWAATDNAGGFASSPNGLTALPVSVAAAEIASDGLREVNFLPAINWDPAYVARIAADTHGDLDPSFGELANSTQANCILYYQKSNSARRTGPTQRTAFMYTLDRLGYAGHYDVYDVQGYGNTNNQLGGRANVAQCAAYALIIQDDGRSSLVPNVPDGVVSNDNKINQAQWYRDYLTQGVSGLAGTATLWILGENTAFQKASNPLFTVDMGLSSIVNDQLVTVNPNVVGSASFTWAGGGVTSFVGDTFTLQGGCPSVRLYDGAIASGTAVVTHNYRSSTTSGTGAIVMNKNTALHWNTVWMGFGWFDIRDTGAPGTPELALATKILNGAVPVGCQRSPTTGVGGDPTTDGLPAVTALHPNVPNPFNPVTEIRFDLAIRGPVALRVFDVVGRQVRALVNETRPAGRYRASWNGLDDAGARVASGIYFYRLDTPAFSASRKMVLLK